MHSVSLSNTKNKYDRPPACRRDPTWRRPPGLRSPLYETLANIGRSIVLPTVLLLAATIAPAQQLPDGPGKAETEKVCSQCHELARSISLHQDRAGWQTTVDKMATLGANASPADLQRIADYLAAHFGAEEVPRININTCHAIDLESGLTLKRSEAAAIIEYRDKNGPFKSIDDLKKIPNIDFAKIEAKKDRLSFAAKP